MRLIIEIKDEVIHGLLISGQDGISYWAAYYNPPVAASSGSFARLGQVLERDTDQWLPLDIRRGVELMVNNHPRYLDPKNLDAVAGDVFIQLCAFGWIKYG